MDKIYTLVREGFYLALAILGLWFHIVLVFLVAVLAFRAVFNLIKARKYWNELGIPSKEVKENDTTT